MKTLTWQKPGQQNVAQELIKIIINYVAELRTTKNHAITFLEKNRQDNLSSIDQIIIEIPGNDLTPEEKLLKKDMEECMQQAIRQLPEKTRIVYCMAKEDHMSYKQISEALDISERTVNTHMTTAIRRLTENLQKYFR